jgi:acetyl esterase/lipase
MGKIKKRIVQTTIMKKLFFIPFIAFILFSCSKTDNNPATDTNAYKEILNETYGPDPAENFDIYLPAGRSTATTRVMIVIHGGSWTSGDKSDLNSYVPLMQAKDASWAIVNINYRLTSTTGNRHPAQINDIQRLMDTLEARKNNYKISSKYAMVGVSAGAHLSMLYAYGYDTPKKIKAVGDIVGPADFTDPSYQSNILFSTAATALLGYTYAQNPALYQEVSPALRATAASAPTTMFYGGLDPLVPNSQHDILTAKLNSLSVPNSYTFYPSEGHGWTGANLTDTINKLMQFLNQYVL